MTVRQFTVAVSHDDSATADLVAKAIRRVIQSLALNATDTRGAVVGAGPITSPEPFTLPTPRSTP